ncbi:MAG TPA: DUF1800 domain-containing protein [Telluria sp.]|nr:DUF1800 domain-containing protein [Telluria sp.]
MSIRHLVVAALAAGAAALALAQTPPPAQAQAAHVLNRIAFGPSPADLAHVNAVGVRAYIEEQLDPQRIPMPSALGAQLAALDAANLAPGAAVQAYQEMRRAARADKEGAKDERRMAARQAAYEVESARLLRALYSPRQLEEVLTDFWFNHFNVFINKGLDRALVASYERDAIRPYVLGNFRDMLGATAKHPAMLFYLDNHLSTAPGFVPRRGGAQANRAGLNENYARELMELHTLGVDGGYTQRDVTELARMLTGWTFTPRDMSGPNDGFRFDPRRHDHGVKHWLGREIKDAGVAEGEYALDVLALQPATARHVSYQLAQYFVADEPPPALVERMAQTWFATKGDLRAVTRTLLLSDEFLSAAAGQTKFKTPYQFVLSAVRASGVAVADLRPLIGALNQAGMPLYGCLTPDGYKNTQQAWLNPDALTRRIAMATALAAGRKPFAQPVDPAALQDTLGPTVSQRTREMVSAAAPQLRAAMLLGSPDFMQH